VGSEGTGSSKLQYVMVSAFHDVSEKLALMANVGWEQWSRFGRVDIGIVDNTARNLTVDLDYKDTWHGALGPVPRLRSVASVPRGGL
jgi:long-chain fatty acid transport protein